MREVRHIMAAIPWDTFASLRYHQRGECLHHSTFYFGYDKETRAYFGSYAKPLSPTQAAERGQAFEMVGLRYLVGWYRLLFGGVFLSFYNPEREHRLEVSVIGDVLDANVIQGVVLPIKFHLHLHLE